MARGGRPKCSKLCCTEPEELIRMYLSGMTQQELADKIGCSHSHIARRLKAYGVKGKSRRDYPPSRQGRGKRTNPLWGVSLKYLVVTPTHVIMERYGVSMQAVSKMRKRRIEEERG